MRDYNRFKDGLLKQRNYLDSKKEGEKGSVEASLTYITDSGLTGAYFGKESNGLLADKKIFLLVSGKLVDLGVNYRETKETIGELNGVDNIEIRKSFYTDEIPDILCHLTSDETKKYIKYYPAEGENYEYSSEYYVIDGERPALTLSKMLYENAADVLQMARRATDEEVEYINVIKNAHKKEDQGILGSGVKYRTLAIKNIVSVEMEDVVYESEYVHNKKAKLMEKYI